MGGGVTVKSGASTSAGSGGLSLQTSNGGTTSGGMTLITGSAALGEWGVTGVGDLSGRDRGRELGQSWVGVTGVLWDYYFSYWFFTFIVYVTHLYLTFVSFLSLYPHNLYGNLESRIHQQ